MENNTRSYQILFDSKSARKFKRKVLGLFREEKIKSLEDLSKVFPKINKNYTKEEGKNFILELCNNESGWLYGSALAYNYFIAFDALKDNKIRVKKEKDYTNEGD
jgi:hypothetical protein